jgi:hypothetical protein
VIAQGMQRGIGFSYNFSSGNSCDVDICDLVNFLIDDEARTRSRAFWKAFATARGWWKWRGVPRWRQAARRAQDGQQRFEQKDRAFAHRHAGRGYGGLQRRVRARGTRSWSTISRQSSRR